MTPCEARFEGVLGDYDRVNTAAVASAGGSRVHVVAGMEPAAPGMRVVGRALTVAGAAGDNLALHQAVSQAGYGEVIVLDVQDGRDTAHCGDTIVRCAMERRIAGIVLNGSIRDRYIIGALGFPVFHRGTCPRPPSAREPGHLRVPLRWGDAVIDTGDLVVADDDGFVVVPADEVDEILAKVVELDAHEREVALRIRAGESTIQIFDLPSFDEPDS